LIPNPLRLLGLARILAGAWFIRSGVETLRQHEYLMYQARRLFSGDLGATDAPVRSLLALIAATGLVLIGLALVAKSLRWVRRLPIPAGGPAAIDQDEAVAVLCRHELPACAEGPTPLLWPLRRWLADDLAAMTRWRRELVHNGVRAFAWSCVLVLSITALCWVLPLITQPRLLGPFPAAFVATFPFMAAIWAGLVLQLPSSDHPRVEAVELPLPGRTRSGTPGAGGLLIESRPRLLDREPPGLALALGLAGIGVQCLLPAWWNLSQISYPLLATSVLRHTASLAGGILFFVLGQRMVTAATDLLLSVRFDSTLVLIEDTDGGQVAHAAAVRTESHGLTGPRQIIAAVGGPHAQETALALLQD
jgi:hypothetical protein